MTVRAKNLAKAAVFGGFLLLSILVGTSWKLDPMAPTRIGENPYAVSVQQLDRYSTQLEGHPVLVVDTALEVRVNDTSGDMQFTISDNLFNISARVLLPGWAPGGVQPAGLAIGNGTLVVIKGVCKLLSTGVVEGTEVHVILQDNVYLVSISGLVVIGIMLFVYFRLDLKRARFTVKKIGNNDERKEGN